MIITAFFIIAWSLFIIGLVAYRMFKHKSTKYNKEDIGLLIMHFILLVQKGNESNPFLQITYKALLVIGVGLLVIKIVGVIKNHNLNKGDADA